MPPLFRDPCVECVREGVAYQLDHFEITDNASRLFSSFSNSFEDSFDSIRRGR